MCNKIARRWVLLLLWCLLLLSKSAEAQSLCRCSISECLCSNCFTSSGSISARTYSYVYLPTPCSSGTHLTYAKIVSAKRLDGSRPGFRVTLSATSSYSWQFSGIKWSTTSLYTCFNTLTWYSSGFSATTSNNIYILIYNPNSYAITVRYDAKYQCLSPPATCEGTVTRTATTTYSTLTDGSATSSTYTAGLNCQWKICASTSYDDHRVQLTFSRFYTQPARDYVKIYDGSSSSATRLRALSGYYSGSSLPVVTSSGRCIYITFTSDSSSQYTGWALSYKAVPPPITCTQANNILYATPCSTSSAGLSLRQVSVVLDGRSKSMCLNMNACTHLTGTSTDIQVCETQKTTFRYAGDCNGCLDSCRGMSSCCTGTGCICQSPCQTITSCGTACNKDVDCSNPYLPCAFRACVCPEVGGHCIQELSAYPTTPPTPAPTPRPTTTAPTPAPTTTPTTTTMPATTPNPTSVGTTDENTSSAAAANTSSRTLSIIGILVAVLVALMLVAICRKRYCASESSPTHEAKGGTSTAHHTSSVEFTTALAGTHTTVGPERRSSAWVQDASSVTVAMDDGKEHDGDIEAEAEAHFRRLSSVTMPTSLTDINMTPEDTAVDHSAEPVGAASAEAAAARASASASSATVDMAVVHTATEPGAARSSVPQHQAVEVNVEPGSRLPTLMVGEPGQPQTAQDDGERAELSPKGALHSDDHITYDM